MRSRGEFIAIERLMREGSNSPYDNGVNGIFEACRTCHFHRPYSSVQICVFPTCPYSICRVSTRIEKPRFRLAYTNKQEIRKWLWWTHVSSPSPIRRAASAKQQPVPIWASAWRRKGRRCCWLTVTRRPVLWLVLDSRSRISYPRPQRVSVCSP